MVVFLFGTTSVLSQSKRSAEQYPPMRKISCSTSQLVWWVLGSFRVQVVIQDPLVKDMQVL